MRRLSGEELRAWRKKHGLTQAELAWLLYVSRDAVSNWETERRKIPPYISYVLRKLEEEGFLE